MHPVLPGRGLRRFPRLHRPAGDRCAALATSRRSRSISSTSDGSLPALRARPQGRARPQDLQARLHASIPTARSICNSSPRATPTASSACSRPIVTCSASTTRKPENGLFLLGTDLLGRDRLVAADGGDARVALDRPGRRRHQPVSRRPARRRFGPLRRRRSTRSIQRLIEIIRSMPTIPLWMGLAAALPNTWSTLQIYFAITVIISFIGWTDLARVVRGRFLVAARGGFRHRRRARGRQPDAHHLPPHAAVVPEPHHRRRQPGAAGHDHQRDVA